MIDILKEISLIVLSLMIVQYGKVIFGEVNAIKQNKITVQHSTKKNVKIMLMFVFGIAAQRHALIGKVS